MMISPEAYYHDSIEGRSPEQILRQIHSLKREIRHLIRVLESDELNSELLIAPHPRTQISLKREYLELAVKAYTDAGGKLELTGIERKEAAFNARLPGMRKLVLEMRGSERYTVTFPEKALVQKEKLSPPEDWKREEYLLPQTFPEFTEALEKMHMGEWKKTYSASGAEPRETRWVLRIEYEEEAPYICSGRGAEPYNFNLLLDLLNGEMFWMG